MNNKKRCGVSGEDARKVCACGIAYNFRCAPVNRKTRDFYDDPEPNNWLNV